SWNCPLPVAHSFPTRRSSDLVGRWGGAPESTDQPERSVYADWFTVMGLSELARATGERHWLEAARPVLERSLADHLAGTAPTPPDRKSTRLNSSHVSISYAVF